MNRAPALQAELDAVRSAVTLDPNIAGGYERLAELLMPGDDYRRVLARLHELLRPRNYVEIGVYQGTSLAAAKSPTLVVGIDPAPDLKVWPRTTCRIFALTSDRYFETRDLRADIEAEAVDLAFIDGRHVFEQALRDFINLERFAGPRTVIVIHDTLPIDAQTSTREPTTRFWTGDVWKLVPCLRELRPALNICTVPVAPSGLTIVCGLDRESRTLSDGFDAIAGRYAALELPGDFEHRKTLFAAVPHEWKPLQRQLLAALPVANSE